MCLLQIIDFLFPKVYPVVASELLILRKCMFVF